MERLPACSMLRACVRAVLLTGHTHPRRPRRPHHATLSPPACSQARHAGRGAAAPRPPGGAGGDWAAGRGRPRADPAGALPPGAGRAGPEPSRPALRRLLPPLCARAAPAAQATPPSPQHAAPHHRTHPISTHPPTHRPTHRRSTPPRWPPTRSWAPTSTWPSWRPAPRTSGPAALLGWAALRWAALGWLGWAGLGWLGQAGLLSREQGHARWRRPLAACPSAQRAPLRPGSHPCGGARGAAALTLSRPAAARAPGPAPRSGAEIEGLVKSATSFALNRQVDVSDLTKAIDEEAIKVGGWAGPGRAGGASAASTRTRASSLAGALRASFTLRRAPLLHSYCPACSHPHPAGGYGGLPSPYTMHPPPTPCPATLSLHSTSLHTPSPRR